ncbi:MAG: VCBS repeat-containing protein [Candidatus Thorarchaeota archaeon]|nr:VCBS repeat-containing protein [Candidatus Thorarchaeota archaeon]
MTGSIRGLSKSRIVGILLIIAISLPLVPDFTYQEETSKPFATSPFQQKIRGTTQDTSVSYESPMKAFQITDDEASLSLASNWTTSVTYFKNLALYNHSGSPANEMYVTEHLDTGNNSVMVLSYDSDTNGWITVDTMTLNWSIYNFHVALTDLDHDNELEYLICYHLDSSNTMYLVVCHLFSGELRPVTNYLTFSDGIYDLQFYDLDDDDTDEIGLVTGYYDSSVYVYKYNGTNLLPYWTKHYGTGFMGSLVFGEVDNDGEVELIVSGAGKLEVFDWTGSTFTLKWTISRGSSLRMFVYDFDEDGTNEILVPDWISDPGLIRKYEWNGASFDVWISTEYEDDITWIELVDHPITSEKLLFIVTRVSALMTTWNGTAFSIKSRIDFPSYALSGEYGNIDSDDEPEIILVGRNDYDPMIYTRINVVKYDIEGPTDATPPSISISHSPTNLRSDDIVEINATITDDVCVDEGILSYRVNDGSWTNLTMSGSSSEYSGVIPPQEANSLVEYKVYANDTSGNWAVTSEYEYVTFDPSLAFASNWTTSVVYFKNHALHNHSGSAALEMYVTEHLESGNNSVCVLSYDNITGSWTTIDTIPLNWSIYNFYVSLTDLDYDGEVEYIVCYHLDDSHTMYMVVCHLVLDELQPITNCLTFVDGVYDMQFYDFDEDGTDEISLVTGFFDSSVYVYKYDGSNLIANWSKTYGGQFLGCHAIGDVDNDNEPELVVSASTTLEIFDWTGTTFVSKWSVSRGASVRMFIYDFDKDETNEIIAPRWLSDSGYIHKYEWNGASFDSWQSIEYSDDITWIEFVDSPSSVEMLLLATRDGVYLTEWNGTQFHVIGLIEEPLYIISGQYGDIDDDAIPEVILWGRNDYDPLVYTRVYVVEYDGSIVVEDTSGPTIDLSQIPSSPTSDDPVTISAELWDQTGVSKVILSYSVDDGPWINVTMTLATTTYTADIPSQAEDASVQYKVYANDTLDNWRISGIQSYIVSSGVETNPPELTSFKYPSSPGPDDYVDIYVGATDESGILQVILSYRVDSGIWTNLSMWIDTVYWEQQIPPQDVGSFVEYKAYAEDTVGNWGVSTVCSYTVSDKDAPVISDVDHSPSSPSENDEVTITAKITDSSGISWAKICYSTGSGWIDVSMSYSVGKYQGKIPTQSIGTTVEYKVVAEDNEGNQAVSSIKSYNIEDSSAPSISVEHTPSSPSEDDAVIVCATITDSSGISEVTLSYSTDSGSTWTDVSMTEEGDTWSASIPKQAAGIKVRYKVTAEDESGNIGESEVVTYTVGAFSSTDLAEEYLQSSETLNGPREVILLDIVYHVFEFRSSGGGCTGYLVIDVGTHAIEEDLEVCDYVLMQDYIQENWIHLEVFGDASSVTHYQSLMKDWDADAEAWESVKTGLMISQVIAALPDIATMGIPVGTILGILSVMFETTDTLAYFSALGPQLTQIGNQYGTIYPDSPFIDMVSCMDDIHDFFGIYQHLAASESFEILGNAMNAASEFGEAAEDITGFTLSKLFTSDTDLMLSDSFVTAAACSALARLCQATGSVYQEIVNGEGDINQYLMLYGLKMQIDSAICKFAEWKINTLSEFKRTASIPTLVIWAFTGYDIDTDIASWEELKDEADDAMETLVTELELIISFTDARVSLVEDRISGVSSVRIADDPQGIQLGILELPVVILFLAAVTSPIMQSYYDKKRNRRIKGLFALVFILLIGAFFIGMYNLLFPAFRPLPSSVEGYTGTPQSLDLFGNDSLRLDYAGIVDYESDEGVLVKTGLLDAKTPEDIGWYILGFNMLLSRVNISLVETAEESGWQIADFILDDGYMRFAYYTNRLLLIKSESMADIETVFTWLQ